MIRIHPTAELSTRATVGDGSQIWHQAQVREDVTIGRNCVLGKGVYVDFGVRIGDNCKLQNGAFVYHGATLEDGVFVGPRVLLTNDKLPRAINPDGTLKSADDWDVGEILVRRGASLGAGCIVLPDVPDQALVVGVPARQVGSVCVCGHRLTLDHRCNACQRQFDLTPHIQEGNSP